MYTRGSWIVKLKSLLLIPYNYVDKPISRIIWIQVDPHIIKNFSTNQFTIVVNLECWFRLNRPHNSTTVHPSLTWSATCSPQPTWPHWPSWTSAHYGVIPFLQTHHDHRLSILRLPPPLKLSPSVRRHDHMPSWPRYLQTHRTPPTSTYLFFYPKWLDPVASPPPLPLPLL
jgi:hypothetical protein